MLCVVCLFANIFLHGITREKVLGFMVRTEKYLTKGVFSNHREVFIIIARVYLYHN